MIKINWYKRIALWYLRRNNPELFEVHTIELEGLYDVHMEKFLFSLTGKARREGGPLRWIDNAYGFNEEGITLLRGNRYLRSHVDNGLWIVPVIKTTEVHEEKPLSSKTLETKNDT
jgi:hypothetical protein